MGPNESLKEYCRFKLSSIGRMCAVMFITTENDVDLSIFILFYFSLWYYFSLVRFILFLLF